MMMFAYGRHGGCGPRGYYAIWGARDGSGYTMGHGRGVRGGGRRRVFDPGELRLVLLKLIEEGPRHGYDLIKAIEERTGGAYAPSPGIVYPTLTLLDDMGQAEPYDSGTTKKFFAITDIGRAELAEKADEVAALMARLSDMGAERAKTDGAPIRRAMGNLRAVLANRLTADNVDSDTLHDVAALIDEAARKIERL